MTAAATLGTANGSDSVDVAGEGPDIHRRHSKPADTEPAEEAARSTLAAAAETWPADSHSLEEAAEDSMAWLVVDAETAGAGSRSNLLLATAAVEL